VMKSIFLMIYAYHCWQSLTIKSDRQLRYKKEEKLTILNTYAFTINQIPHVFEGYCFVGHKHKYMEKITEMRFLTLIRAKEQGRCPSTRLKPSKAPPRSDPSPAHSPPCEGGGQPLGVGDPLSVPLGHPLLWRWHASMQRRCSSFFAPKNSL
jgi:hypothetical protein